MKNELSQTLTEILLTLKNLHILQLQTNNLLTEIADHLAADDEHKDEFL